MVIDSWQIQQIRNSLNHPRDRGTTKNVHMLVVVGSFFWREVLAEGVEMETY